MLEPPPVPDSLITSRLRGEYDLQINRLTFLPLGADLNTASYQVEADGTDYFLKLRKGDFNEISVTVPRFLHKQGIDAIITPLPTQNGRLWGRLDAYRMILYPYVAGYDGYERALTPNLWQAFGSLMAHIHAAQLPDELNRRIPHETFTAVWRESVRDFQQQVETVEFTDPVAVQLASFMRAQRTKIKSLVDLADQLAHVLQPRAQLPVLCHGDLHAGNLLLPTADTQGLYIVDWDNPLYAPRERDLALIGGSYTWRQAEDIALFYRGYYAESARHQDGLEPNAKLDVHPADIDPTAIRYYRSERIIVDIVEFCKELLLTTTGGQDRAQSYRYFISLFLPDHEVDLALGGSSGFHHGNSCYCTMDKGRPMR
jgi:spectinomycin phosphotransferase